MNPDLDTLRSEIQDYVESRGLAIFHGFPGNEPAGAVYWDRQAHPDFRDFIGAAEKAGVRLITMFTNEFSGDMMEDAEQRLDALAGPERGEVEARLRALRRYAGLICQIELSFDLGPRVYFFDIRTDWYEEWNDILDQIEEAEQEDETPLGGGYFSKN
jgi:hypothetical protein